MALDLSSIAPEARAAFIKDGERFSSEDTLEQANLTLNGYALHGPKLAAFGFLSEDAGELTDARDALITAGVGREARRTTKRIDTVAYADAMRDGQGGRLRARAVLRSARRVLGRSGATAAVAQKIDVLLRRESVAEDEPEGLAKQLDALAALLRDQAIVDVTKTRGGPEAIKDLDTYAKALRAVARTVARPRGTPVETETLDLLDGIIISLVRSAREAAEAAARALGEPAIAIAFELSALYKRRAKKKGEEPQGGGTEQGGKDQGGKTPAAKVQGDKAKGDKAKGDKAKAGAPSGDNGKGDKGKGDKGKAETPGGGKAKGDKSKGGGAAKRG